MNLRLIIVKFSFFNFLSDFPSVNAKMMLLFQAVVDLGSWTLIGTFFTVIQFSSVIGHKISGFFTEIRFS